MQQHPPFWVAAHRKHPRERGNSFCALPHKAQEEEGKAALAAMFPSSKGGREKRIGTCQKGKTTRSWINKG